MLAYLIAKITIRDRAEYAKYEAGFMEIFSAMGGKLRAALSLIADAIDSRD